MFPRFYDCYVPSFPGRRRPRVNFAPFSSGLGYTTNNSRKDVCMATLQTELSSVRALSLREFAAESPHVTLEMSLRVYRELFAESRFQTFPLPSRRSRQPAEIRGTARARRPVGDESRSCPPVAVGLLVFGTQQRHFSFFICCWIRCKCDFGPAADSSTSPSYTLTRCNQHPHFLNFWGKNKFNRS